MKKYNSLYKLFYSAPTEYKKEYEKRFYSDDTIHFNVNIGKSQAFLCQTAALYKKILSIERNDKIINKLCSELPPKAIEHFATRCLIDEIIITNNIEGVHSTRKEVTDILSDLSSKNKRKRFEGLVKKYILLMSHGDVPIQSCADIRSIYDDIFFEEIKESDITNLPDGELFRKDSVSVYSPTGKEIHRGLYPETKIADFMNKSLDILHNEEIEKLFRVAIFHYFFGYAHPFYDGNGRTSRFISSYLLSRMFNSIVGYRISYTIKENLNDYYDAFKICNHPNNKGDLTPFVEMFLNIINISSIQLCQALEKRVTKLEFYKNAIMILPNCIDEKIYNLYYVLIQASLFSDLGIPTNELLEFLNISPNTLRKKLNYIPQKLVLIEKRGKKKYYSINIQVLDKYITDFKE